MSPKTYTTLGKTYVAPSLMEALRDFRDGLLPLETRFEDLMDLESFGHVVRTVGKGVVTYTITKQGWKALEDRA